MDVKNDTFLVETDNFGDGKARPAGATYCISIRFIGCRWSRESHFLLRADVFLCMMGYGRLLGSLIVSPFQSIIGGMGTSKSTVSMIQNAA
jgi:hypothetical protein